MSSILPKQKISKKEKTLGWYKENARYRISQANYHRADRNEMAMLYRAAAGSIDESYYAKILNPYNTEVENIVSLPATIRNIDIITPILNSLMGEKANLPFNHSVIVANPDTTNQAKEKNDNDFMRAVAQSFVNDLNSSGVDTGVKSQEVPPYEKILQNYNVDNDDKRALFGQEALNYIKHELQLKDKFQEGFYDWLVCGRAITYKDVYKNDLIHEIVPALELWHGTTRTGMIEDCDWAVRRTRYNLSNVIDRFHEKLSDTVIDAIEVKFRHNPGPTVEFIGTVPNIDKAANAVNDDINKFAFNNDLIDIWHVEWKGFQKVGILKYKDQLGQIQEAEVSEEYKLSPENGDIEIEWIWNSVVHEIYRIGDDGDDFYLCDREVQVQRNQLSNSSIVKLSYNGKVGYNERSSVNSIVKQLIPYAVLYNVIHLRRELTLARNKDKILMMPIGLMPDEFTPDKDGMSRYLQFIEATGVAFFDESKPNAGAILQALKGIDMGLGSYVSSITEILREVKMEAWDAIGMNRQRFGDVNSSDGKATTEQALFRSSVITKELNRRFSKFEESECQGLIDYSKVAWINGKKGMYINSDGQKAFLEVNPDEHLNTDYGVFVIDSQEEYEKLNKAKDYAFGWAQKSTVSASTVIEILDSNNMSSLKAKITKAEKVQQEYEDYVRQQESTSQQNLQAMKDAQDAKNNQTKIQVAEIMADGNVKSSAIRAASSGSDIAKDTSQIEDNYSSIIDGIMKEDQRKREEGAKLMDTFNKTRLGEANLQLGKDKLESAERIAKMNKNKYDKK